MISAEILQSIGTCMHEITTSYGLYLSMLMAGLVGGFSHCIVMCGPFILSQSQNLDRISGDLLFPYHLGRLTTYVILAIIFSSILNLAFLFLPIRGLVIAPLLMFAGIIFLVTAFPKLGKIFPWAVRVTTGIPFKYINRFFTQTLKTNRLLKSYVMGLILGLMPCGLIVAAVMAAASAPTSFHAALAMMMFGLGTMPALIGLSLGARSLIIKYPIAMLRIKQAALVWSGIWLFTLAGLMLI
jgi:uncharacterized protein